MPKPGPRTTNKYSDRQQMRWMSRTAKMPSIKLAESPVVDSAVGANVVPTWRSRNVVWRSDMGRLNVPRLPGLATKRAQENGLTDVKLDQGGTVQAESLSSISAHLIGAYQRAVSLGTDIMVYSQAGEPKSAGPAPNG